MSAEPDPDAPEFLAPSWTYALGGPAPEPIPEPADQEDAEGPQLEPVPVSDTLRRLRAQMVRARVNRHHF